MCVFDLEEAVGSEPSSASVKEILRAALVVVPVV
jgi:hypothetical protein